MSMSLPLEGNEREGDTHERGLAAHAQVRVVLLKVSEECDICHDVKGADKAKVAVVLDMEDVVSQ